MAALRAVPPKLPASMRIASPRRRFAGGSFALMMHLELFTNRLVKDLQDQRRQLPPHIRTMATQQGDFRTLPSKPRPLGKMAMPTLGVPSIDQIVTIRTPFDPAIPRGRLGMLMKGLEESLQSLHTRLDMGAHPTKSQTGS